jgi:putative flavoprotein involved in K+ transport
VTEVPGLFFLGLSWQHTRGSALIGWVKDDAEFIAEQIAALAEAAVSVEGDAIEREAVSAPAATPVTEGA